MVLKLMEFPVVKELYLNELHDVFLVDLESVRLDAILLTLPM